MRVSLVLALLLFVGCDGVLIIDGPSGAPVDDGRDPVVVVDDDPVPPDDDVVIIIEGDADGDGILDGDDMCPETPAGLVVRIDGCALEEIDSDDDGYTDAEEVFGAPATDPNDPLDTPITVVDSDLDGCSDYEEFNLDGFCDGDPFTPDLDLDGVPNFIDNCPLTANAFQTDADLDEVGDACDLCLGGDDRFDLDADGIPDDCDNCIDVGNVSQSDIDDDGIGDICDNCPDLFNPDQADFDRDGLGDVCGADFDEDGVPDDVDNCVFVFNPDQADLDRSGFGDACEALVADPFVITALYGGSLGTIVELNDGTVWQVQFGSTFGWLSGDFVSVDFDGVMVNLDTGEDVTALLLGLVDVRTTVFGVSVTGDFIELSDGGAWDVEAADHLSAFFWDPGDDVTVVIGVGFFDYLVREQDGGVLRVTPSP